MRVAPTRRGSRANKSEASTQQDPKIIETNLNLTIRKPTDLESKETTKIIPGGAKGGLWGDHVPQRMKDDDPSLSALSSRKRRFRFSELQSASQDGNSGTPAPPDPGLLINGRCGRLSSVGSFGSSARGCPRKSATPLPSWWPVVQYIFSAMDHVVCHAPLFQGH